MIGFIGLSHLGLNYSLATAAKGNDVVCFDPDQTLVARLSAGDFPIDEPGFRELYEANRSRIKYTSSKADLGGCALVFYGLDVLTNARNESDLGPLTALIESTAPDLDRGATAVVLSQVRPGYMRELVHRMEGLPLIWYYQVETLIFGAAVQRAMEPERFIIGAQAPGSPLPEDYGRWLAAFTCPRLVMRLESAELAKIAINFFLVSSVATTNTLAELCEAIGADWNEIAPALRLDRRIGPDAYLKPGLGIAGGNLERDLVTVQGLSAEHGTESGVVGAWQRNSTHAKAWAARTLERELLGSNPSATLAVWGLAYKQDTHSTKNSASLELISRLSAHRIEAYDPVAKVKVGFFPNLNIHSGALEALKGAEALVIMTPWKEFSAISPAKVRSALKGRLVIDPYRMMDSEACKQAGLVHFQIGRAA